MQFVRKGCSKARFSNWLKRIDTVKIGHFLRSNTLRIFWSSLLIATLLCIIPASPAYAANVDMRTFKKEGLAATGNWISSADGTEVRQTMNENPTFFTSKSNFIGGRVTGTFYVSSAEADPNENMLGDYLGFVFGYQHPIETKGDAIDDYEFILFDWKNQSQKHVLGPWGYEGFTLNRVDGIIEYTDAWKIVRYFWGHQDDNGAPFDVLATNFGAGLGWRYDVTYGFEASYTATNMKVTVSGGAFGAGTVIFDVNGVFHEGRFGFYNYAQPGVHYALFAGHADDPTPVVGNDTYSVNEDITLTVLDGPGVLNNDYSPDLGNLVVELQTSTTHGALTLNANGSFTYVPVANYNGVDSFTYKAFDGIRYSPAATVNITVNPVNDPPDPGGNTTVIDPNTGGAVNVPEDFIPTAPNIRLDVPVLNDPDGLVPAAIRVISVDGGTLYQSNGAAITLGAAGTILNLTAGNYDFRFSPDPNRETNASFVYVVVDPDDNSVNSGQSTATIPLAAINDPPVLQTSGGVNGEGLYGTYYISSWDLTGQTANRIDATIDFASNLQGAGPATVWGTPGVSPNNFSVRWTGKVKAPANGTYTFKTLSNDGVRLWVDGQSIIDNWTDHADTWDSGTIDLVAGTRYDIKLEYYEKGTGEAIQLNWDYPGQAQQVIPQASLYAEVSRLSLAYTENDGATVIDDRLTVTDPDNTNLQSATISIASGFVAGQDVLSFTDQNGITGSYNAATGVLTLTGASTVANYQTALRSITYTNTSDNPGTATRTFRFIVNDGTDSSNATTRSFVLAAVNDPPVANDDTVMVLINTVTVISPLTNDTDAEGNALTITNVTVPARGTAVIDAGNTTITYTPQLDYTGADTFTYTISDGNGGNDTGTINITVVDDGGAPSLAVITVPVDGRHYNGLTIPAAVSGLAADNAGGVGLNAHSTTFTLRRASDNQYWDGAAWQGAATWLATTHPATNSDTQANWNSNVALPAWTFDTYFAQPKAIDKVGTTFTGGTISFVFDDAGPTVNINDIPDGPAPVQIAGTAADGLPGIVDKVQLAIMNTENNKYWDGDSWEAAVTWFDASGTNSWTYDSSGIDFDGDVTYRVRAKATDKAGNGSPEDTEDFKVIPTAAPVNPVIPVVPGGGGPTIEVLKLRVDMLGKVSEGDITSVGQLLEDIHAPDEQVTITLDFVTNTMVLDNNNQCLTLITVEIANERPEPPPNGRIFGEVYAISPDGAAFGPEIVLTLYYKQDELPAGIDEKSLYIAFYDGSHWIVPIQYVDTENNRVIAYLTLLRKTKCALLYKLPPPPPPPPPVPPELYVVDLEISPREVDPGETVNISAVAGNKGGSPGNLNVMLQVAGVEEAKNQLLLNPGDRKLSFTTDRAEPGVYWVELNGLRDWFVVKTPPAVPQAPVPLTCNWHILIIAWFIVLLVWLFFFVRRQLENDRERRERHPLRD